MEIILLLASVTILIVLANVLAVRDRVIEKRIFTGLLFLLNLPFLFIGLLFLFVPDDVMRDASELVGFIFGDYQSIGLSLALMAAWGMLVTLMPVRRLMARLMKLDPSSPVHTLALVMVGYLVGQSGLTWSQGGLEGLTATAEPTTISILVISELLFAFVALLGTGLLIRRHGRELMQRLGLVKPQPRHLLVGLALIGVLVIFQGIVGAAWAWFNPEQAEILEDLNTILLADMDTLWEWLALALAAGIGEELLFRGALQPVMGLGFTAAVFALVHVQYGFSPILIFVALLAVILGLVRRYYNTTTAIFIHVGYDFALGLLALLATYLEPLAS